MHRIIPAPTTLPAKVWAKLMARVGEEFPLLCPSCGGDGHYLLGERKFRGSFKVAAQTAAR